MYTRTLYLPKFSRRIMICGYTPFMFSIPLTWKSCYMSKQSARKAFMVEEQFETILLPTRHKLTLLQILSLNYQLKKCCYLFCVVSEPLVTKRAMVKFLSISSSFLCVDSHTFFFCVDSHT